MITNILKDKPTKLFLSITAFFVANALIAECIGGKIFSLEKTRFYLLHQLYLCPYVKNYNVHECLVHYLCLYLNLVLH